MCYNDVLQCCAGTVVVGEEPLDDAWWRGRAYGKTGVFPLNFVWQLRRDLIQVTLRLGLLGTKMNQVLTLLLTLIINVKINIRSSVSNLTKDI